MSRTFRKTLIGKERQNTIRIEKLVNDGKHSYKCKCAYCISEDRNKIIKKTQLKEIKQEL